MSCRTPSTLCSGPAIAIVLLFASTTPAFGFLLFQTLDTGQLGNNSNISLVACNHPGGFLHWDTLDIEWRLNEANQGSGKAGALRNALEAWNDVTEAGHVLRYGWTTTAGLGMDGINTVLWDTNGLCEGDCRAITILTVQAGQVIVDSDILFRNDLTWNTNGADLDTQSHLTHELGHSLGIAHSDLIALPFPTMSAFSQLAGLGARTLEDDDREALRCAYDRYHPCTGPPATPSYISGPDDDLCQGATEIYSTDHIPGADSYRWEVVGTWFSSTTGNNEVALAGFSFSPGYYQIRVRAQNDCGNSAWRNANLFVLPSHDPACGSCSGRLCFGGISEPAEAVEPSLDQKPSE